MLCWHGAHAVEQSQLLAAQEALAAGASERVLELLPAVTVEPALAAEERERRVIAATLRGHALAALEEHAQAQAAYGRALDMDPEQRAAGEGLIASLAASESWEQLLAVASAWAQRPGGRPELLLLALEAAQQQGDVVLGLQLAQLGIARHPGDYRFRLHLAQHLQTSGQWGLAEQTWLHLLRQPEASAEWWQALAVVRQQRNDAAGARQALAVAQAMQPDQTGVRVAYLQALLAAEHADAALRQAQALMQQQPAPAEVLLAVRAAWQADAHRQASTWLRQVPAQARDADWQRWSLHLALEQADVDAARAAAETLIRDGHDSARIRLQAARLAEQEDDSIAAESHLRVALQATDADLVHLARLHLSRLLLSRERLDEAESLARAAADARPTDATAARLLDFIKDTRLQGVRHRSPSETE